MYKVELIDDRAGRGVVVVKREDGRFVSSASIQFVRWMHDRVPNNQLSIEQAALVNWYEKQDFENQPINPEVSFHRAGGAPSMARI